EIHTTGRIRDPIHDYIPFTSIEHAIFSHRAAQRLRYVSQNGLAHLVYPEARGSRFSHALGSMHLASHFLSSALRNALPQVRRHAMDAILDIVAEASGANVDPIAAARY